MSGLKAEGEAGAVGDSNISAAVVASDESNYVESVFAGIDKIEPGVAASGQRTNFAPWHHPVKQIVRDYQWGDSVKKLIEEHRNDNERSTLRYFTLPGADLLDVRVLADALVTLGTKIEYFGFDSGYSPTEEQEAQDNVGTYLAAESALRQAERITDKAEILKDKLEDIASRDSHAAERLRQRGVFDVINIDACDHLGYVPAGRSTSIFDALEELLAHQLRAEMPWLLFVTTRANTALLGGPITKLQAAILKNLELHSDDFGVPLAECIGGKNSTLVADMTSCWSKQSLEFLKLFSIGLGKYLLQYFHAQPNLPARVELVSAFAYKVSSEEPDMLSLAFRISPKGLVAQAASAGGATPLPNLELDHALAIVSRAMKMWDLDAAIGTSDEVRSDAVKGTEQLLDSANYDIPRWRAWLRDLSVRPMNLDAG